MVEQQVAVRGRQGIQSLGGGGLQTHSPGRHESVLRQFTIVLSIYPEQRENRKILTCLTWSASDMRVLSAGERKARQFVPLLGVQSRVDLIDLFLGGGPIVISHLH